MDGNGDIGLGYSVSSSTVRPGLRYTAHAVGDPLGVMGQGEGVMVNGTGSQTAGLNRWGDYSSLNIDPADDCTFWLTSEYLTTNGTWNWHTRIGTFKVSGCGTTPTPDFSLSASPSSSTVTAGQGTSYAVTLTPIGRIQRRRRPERERSPHGRERLVQPESSVVDVDPDGHNVHVHSGRLLSADHHRYERDAQPPDVGHAGRAGAHTRLQRERVADEPYGHARWLDRPMG